VDFGGVLTTDVFASFRELCEHEGIDPDTVKRLFREDPDALALLRRLERGEIEADEFSERFGAMMGVADTDGLIDRLFAGMRPDEAMHEAVRRARAGGVRTALVSNSWSTSHYDRSSLDQLFDAIVISGEVGLNKPDAEIFELAADRVGVPAG
jgi:FMN phosphatase YigB (HAD superfamily)